MLRRTAAILATTAVLALGFMPSASAQQEPELDPYGAGAQATALQISIAGQLEAAFSVTGAVVTGEPGEAAANGAAALITGAAEDLTTAQTPGGPATAQDCILDEDLPSPLNLAGLDLACVDMTTNADPSASSVSEELGLAVTSPDVLDDVLESVLAPLLDQILGGLDPILSEVPGLDETVDSLIATVLGNVTGGTRLATVSLAPTSSVAEEAAARGQAQGIVVQLLPDLSVIGGVPLPPLVIITIGDAFADARYDATTGEVVTDGQAAFIDVDLAGLEALVNILVPQVEEILDTALDVLGLGDLGPILGPILAPVFDGLATLLGVLDTQIEDVVNVTVDQLACNDSNPLAMVLCFTAGGVTELDADAAAALGYDFGPGTRGVQAEVLDLALLSALGEDPLLGLRVGGASAAAAASPAAPPQAPPTTAAPAPDAPPSLPRTGADSAMPLALGLFAVAGIGAALLRRTRTV